MKTNAIFKIKSIALAAIGLFAAQSSQAIELDPAPVIRCSCEHYGSPYDGICDAQIVSGENDAWGQSRFVRLDWSPFGYAYMPYGYDQSGGAYYATTRRAGGGLIVTLTYRQTAGLAKINISEPGFVSKTCLIGTVGSD